MIRYTASLEGIGPEQLRGFFVGWPKPPSPEKHLALLRGSRHVALAVDDQTRRVVGFVNAVGDGVISAYIPLLEVLPEYQGRGIGSELIRRLLDNLKDYYMVDLLCDADVRPFYDRLNFIRATGMMQRRRENL